MTDRNRAAEQSASGPDFFKAEQSETRKGEVKFYRADAFLPL